MAEKTDALKKLVEKRLSELDDERRELEDALRKLGGRTRRGPGRPRKAGSRTRATGGRTRRKRKGGTRSEQALKAVKAKPGITAGEVAKQLKIEPNYVYRVMGDLVKEKSVKKKGRGYYPA